MTVGAEPGVSAKRHLKGNAASGGGGHFRLGRSSRPSVPESLSYQASVHAFGFSSSGISHRFGIS